MALSKTPVRTEMVRTRRRLLKNDLTTLRCVSSLYFLGVASSSSNLRVVDVEECEQYTDETSTVLARGCINLESLTLNGCESVSIAGVLQLATHCSSLKSLGLLSVPVDNEVLIQLSLRCRSLTSLYMFRCEGGPITEAGIHP